MKYVGVKILEHAEQMNLGDYNKFKGWTIPENENPETEGYKVIYKDDYISWSPKKEFEDAYIKLDDDCKLTQENFKNEIERFIAIDSIAENVLKTNK